MIMAPVTKRKHVTLTLKQKLEILEKLEKGQIATSLALEYGCGRQTISDFKNKKAMHGLPQILLFMCSTRSMCPLLKNFN